MHHRSTSINTQGVWIYMAVALLALVLQETSGSPAQRPLVKHRSKRSFFDLKCRGIYDSSLFAQVDRICDDCYDLFRETMIYSQCRQQCFTSMYYKGCVDALMLQERLPSLQDQIRIIAGAEFSLGERTASQRSISRVA